METKTIDYFGIDEALIKLKKGFPITRKAWERKKLFVFKQIPAEIGINIIPNMQSVPEMVKNIMVNREQSLKYDNQMAIVDKNGHVAAWIPSSIDIWAQDYFIYS